MSLSEGLLLTFLTTECSGLGLRQSGAFFKGVRGNFHSCTQSRDGGDLRAQATDLGGQTREDLFEVGGVDFSGQMFSQKDVLKAVAVIQCMEEVERRENH